MVNEGFLSGQDFDYNYYYNHIYSLDFVPQGQLQYLQSVFTNGSAYMDDSRFRNLTNEECMTTYGTSFLTGYSDVLLITNATATNATDTLFAAAEEYQVAFGISYSWICADRDPDLGCNIGDFRQHAANWTIQKKPIEYCISKLEPAHCKLQVSITILAVVIVMNACKSASMFWLLFNQRVPTLVTVSLPCIVFRKALELFADHLFSSQIGDAVASYLDEPDELTKGRCLMGKRDVDEGLMKWRVKPLKQPILDVLPKACEKMTKRSPGRWISAVSVRRSVTTNVLIIATLVAASIILNIGATSLQHMIGRKSAFATGFGRADGRAMLDLHLPSGGSGGLTRAVLIANLPQAICSFLYLAYNGLYTVMLLANEWSRYIVSPKRPLRVTTPRGQQRSTWYLQLPFTYSVPLIAASGLLHWLISQSLFLVRVEAFRNGKQVVEESFSRVGYSVLPTLLVICLGLVRMSMGESLYANQKHRNGVDSV